MPENFVVGGRPLVSWTEEDLEDLDRVKAESAGAIEPGTEWMLKQLLLVRRTLKKELAEARRRMETMPPWRLSERPTDEELYALRCRWAFGPEKYQADADVLIAEVLRGREEAAEAAEVRETLAAFAALGRQSVCVVIPQDGGGLYAAIRARKHEDAVELPGGGVEAGEEPTEAARREAEEELGVPVRIVAPIGVFPHVFRGQPWRAHAFLGKVEGSRLGEGDAGPAGWFSREDLFGGTYGPVVRRVFKTMEGVLIRRLRAEAAAAGQQARVSEGVVAGFRARLAGEVADLRARIDEVTRQRDSLRCAVALGAGLRSLARAPRWRHVANALGYEEDEARALCVQAGFGPTDLIGGMPGTLDDVTSCEAARAILDARPDETVSLAATRVLHERQVEIEGLRLRVSHGEPKRKLGIYTSGDGLVVAARSFDHARRLAADYSASGGWIRAGDSMEVSMRDKAGGVALVRVGELRAKKELEPGVLFVPDHEAEATSEEAAGR